MPCCRSTCARPPRTGAGGLAPPAPRAEPGAGRRGPQGRGSAPRRLLGCGGQARVDSAGRPAGLMGHASARLHKGAYETAAMLRCAAAVAARAQQQCCAGGGRLGCAARGKGPATGAGVRGRWGGPDQQAGLKGSQAHCASRRKEVLREAEMAGSSAAGGKRERRRRSWQERAAAQALAREEGQAGRGAGWS